MKVGIVTDAIGVATDAADASEPTLVDIPAGVPVVTDRAYDSYPLRGRLAGEGFWLLAPHRRNRVKPPTNDGRRMRRYDRRWVVERTLAWLHAYRRVVTRRAGYPSV